MRLIRRDKDGSLHFEEFEDVQRPAYAILSHTWAQEKNAEITFDDFENGAYLQKESRRKLEFCARKTLAHDLKYFWIDTCCIDKRNSAELGEALISMFKWYKDAARCYVLLDDVEHGTEMTKRSRSPPWALAFRNSRWFRRGWTLQELIAPREVLFYSKEGTFLDSKAALSQQICEIAGIPASALKCYSLLNHSIEERFAWMSNRETTRPEDQAYCLQGIFNIHMLPMYGEGEEAALARLRRKLEPNLNTLEHRASQETSDSQTEVLRSLMESLQFDEMDDRFNTIKRNHKATCQWILSSVQYETWQKSSCFPDHHGFLWIKGKPGSGKSTLAKYLFEQIKLKSADHLVISFFFNARGSLLEKSTAGLYRSLLHQLLSKLAADPQSLDLAKWKHSSQGWTTERLEYCFERVVQSLPAVPVYIVVDALDECGESEVRAMVRLFEILREQAVKAEKEFRVCLSSRHYPHITVEKYVELVVEEQTCHSQDIDKYLHSELKIGKSKKAESIRQQIRDRASGVFMWVVLVTSILNRENDRGRIHALQNKLNEIPDGLDELFRDIVTRDTENLDELILALKWLLHSQRPLKSEEFYFAVLAGVDGHNIEAWDSTQTTQEVIQRFVVHSTKGLAETTKSKAPKVQFIHESVRDFLLGNHDPGSILHGFRPDHTAATHDQLKNVCLEYAEATGRTLIISDPELGEGCNQAALFRATADNSILGHWPFAEYACRYLLKHADVAQSRAVSQETFLSTFPSIPWLTLSRIYEQHRNRRYKNGTSKLYILADQGCSHLIHALPDFVPFGLSGRASQEPEGKCAFVAAILGKHRDAAVATLAFDSTETTFPIEVEGIERELEELIAESSRSKYPSCKSVLPFLAQHGKVALIKYWKQQQVLRGSGVADSVQQRAFVYAAQAGHTTTLQTLLDLGFHPETDRSNRLTGRPVAAAAATTACNRSSTKLVRILLSAEPRPSVNSYSDFQQPPLISAVERGNSELVQILLDAGALLYYENNHCYLPRCPLVEAVNRNHVNLIPMLLEISPDISKITAFNLALQSAYANRREAILQVLISKAVMLKSREGLTTILFQACRCGDLETTRLVLDLGCDAKGSSPTPFAEYRPPLLAAATARRHYWNNNLSLLHDAQIDRNLPSEDYGGVVRLLLKAGADPALGLSATNPDLDASGSCTKYHAMTCALQLAAEWTNKEVIRVLLDAGVDMDLPCGVCNTSVVDRLKQDKYGSNAVEALEEAVRQKCTNDHTVP